MVYFYLQYTSYLWKPAMNLIMFKRHPLPLLSDLRSHIHHSTFGIEG